MLAGRFRVGNFGNLSTVPNSNDPYDFSLLPIEESVRRNNYFSMRLIWKLRQTPSGIWKAFQPLKNLFSPLTESLSGHRIVSSNVCQCPKKLGTPAWCEPYPHGFERSTSASANTSSRSYPLPAAISLSPRARSLRILRSCSPFS